MRTCICCIIGAADWLHLLLACEGKAGGEDKEEHPKASTYGSGEALSVVKMRMPILTFKKASRIEKRG